ADLKQLPKPEALTKGDQFSVSGFSWSPDGKRIAFSATRDPDLGSQPTEQIYVLDLADRHLRKLTDTSGPNSRPKWSPDGQQIAFTTAAGSAFHYYTNRRLAVVPVEGGALSILTAGFDADMNPLRWGPDGSYFSALQKPNAHIFRLNPTTRQMQRISGPGEFHLADATFTSDHRTLAGTGAAPNRFAEVLVSPVENFAPRYLTDIAG